MHESKLLIPLTPLRTIKDQLRYFALSSGCTEHSLRSKRFHSSYSAKVEAGAKKKNGRGRGKGEEVPSLPSPLPLHSFFLLSSPFSRRTRAEPLATQATRNIPEAFLMRPERLVWFFLFANLFRPFPRAFFLFFSFLF